MLYPNNMRLAPRQRSLAEMANEQINGGKRRGQLAGAIEDAGVPDCLAPQTGKEVLGGLLALPGLAMGAFQGKCK